MSSTPSYITRESLSSLLKSSPDALAIAIIDVRDEDHVGGHIKGSQHVPSATLDHALPELVRTLQQKQKVVFHCALSQQRGPNAARRYLQLRERERLRKHDAGGSGGEHAPSEQEQGQDQEHEQEVLILDGGFTKWQEKYGPDVDLTENYDAEVWAFGY